MPLSIETAPRAKDEAPTFIQRAKKEIAHRKPRKQIVIFFVMGFLGTNLEIISRVTDLVGFEVSSKEPKEHITFLSFAGWSSLWMIPIYGMIGLVLGMANERKAKKWWPFGWEIGKWRMIWQCLIALTFILLVEYTTGTFLNRICHLAIWSYEKSWGNIDGQICPFNACIFFALTPFGFWLDDMIRWIGYNEKQPPKLKTYFCLFKKRDVHEHPQKLEPRLNLYLAMRGQRPIQTTAPAVLTTLTEAESPSRPEPLPPRGQSD